MLNLALMPATRSSMAVPANTLTRAYFHLYKPGSPPSVLKVNQHHNQDRVIKQIHITYAELQRK